MSMPVRSYIKDPEALLDYPIDWSDWLGADTITGTPVWTVPAGLTLAAESNTTTTATAWLSGGTDGVDYIVECKITTVGGRVDERSIRIAVREK
ncbi:MAG: hypothetical protein AB7Q16_05885 [Vicinamibacterales bacterium]